MLAEASAALISSLDYETTLATVAQLAVPDFADECIVEMRQDDGAIACVASATKRGERRRCLSSAVLRSGATELVRAVIDPELSASGVRSYLVVPLTARGKVLGALCFLMTESGRSYARTDLAVAEDLARRAGLAMENALRFREAQAASSARDDLLAVVSHDLRNPLNVVSASAGMLKRQLHADDLPDKVRSTAAMIDRAVGRMDRLISDLLDVSQIEAKRLSIEPSEQDVSSLVSEAAEMLRPLAAQKSQIIEAEVDCDADPDARGSVVRCDRERILQVFANLGGNAVKFTAEGGSIAIRARTEGAAVVFAVTDTGPGITAEQLAHVFERYWRARSHRREGTGLGLSIAKAIVEAHGGIIRAESAIGVGSTFTFTLPLHTPASTT
jgi:signal transduction histidine kinase